MIAKPSIAIVDFGMGNLFSVRQACEVAGMEPVVTAEPAVIEGASGVILPGVGAFGDAMAALHDKNLVGTLQRVASSGKPLFGICLGMQLLMDESAEFGNHKGLGLIAGTVKRLPSFHADERIKVPQVGWNRIAPVRPGSWHNTGFDDLPTDSHVYFVHSYYVEPTDPQVVLAQTTYGGFTYCSALRSGNLHAYQFHPEKSGEHGIAIYRNVAKIVKNTEESRARP